MRCRSEERKATWQVLQVKGWAAGVGAEGIAGWGCVRVAMVGGISVTGCFDSLQIRIDRKLVVFRFRRSTARRVQVTRGDSSSGKLECCSALSSLSSHFEIYIIQTKVRVHRRNLILSYRNKLHWR